MEELAKRGHRPAEDSVHDVLRVEENAISPTSGNDLGAVSELCLRGEEFISIVDVDRVLDLRADE